MAHNASHTVRTKVQIMIYQNILATVDVVSWDITSNTQLYVGNAKCFEYRICYTEGWNVYSDHMCRC